MNPVRTPSAFTPTSIIMEPAKPPNELDDALLNSLTRTRLGYRGQPWGAFLTYLVALIPPGVLPLIVWHHRFMGLMSVEQQQYWQLADFLRLRTKKSEAVALRDQFAAELNPPTWISPALRALAGIGLAAILLLGITQFRTFSSSTFWEASVGMATSKSEMDQELSGSGVSSDEIKSALGFSLPVSDVDPAPYNRFWKFCALLLLAGYSIHWYEIHRHARALTRYANQFNIVTAAEGLAPVKITPVGIGYQTGWISAAVISFLLQPEFLWMLPMAMAGVIHARYVLVTSRGARVEFASRLRTLQGKSSSESAVPLKCPNVKCAVPIAMGMAFCPRCGARTGLTA